MVAKSTPNGYTLLTHSSAHIVSASLKAHLPYSPLRDFVPVAPLTSQAYVLVVSKQAGISSVKELTAAAKAKPGEFNFTSAGIGSGTHLMAEKFNVGAGIKLGHVPTVGAAAGNDAVISGRALYWFSSITPAMPHIRATASSRATPPNRFSLRKLFPAIGIGHLALVIHSTEPGCAAREQAVPEESKSGRKSLILPACARQVCCPVSAVYQAGCLAKF